MARTRHMMDRMNHRGITQDLVDLTLQHGRSQQDKYVLDRKVLQHLLTEVRERERTILRALDKGGVVVVECENHLVTTYTPKSYDRRRVREDFRERKWSFTE
jgi:hypothetical protein